MQFTSLNFEKVVEPSRQASFEYSLIPSENFNGRPFGLVINLNYMDAVSTEYVWKRMDVNNVIVGYLYFATETD